MKRILIVEDDIMMNEGIAFALRREGYGISMASSIKEASSLLNEVFDLIILDINLPDGDGRTFLEKVREGSNLPVILLTARDSESDIVEGFDCGCDDYLTKPFSIAVLIKRVAAVLKRTNGREDGNYYSKDLTYRSQQKELWIQNEKVNLTVTEIKLLELFIQNKNQVLTREQIIDRVWDKFENFVDDKTLNVNIRRLREKIEADPKNPKFILTVFGIGYKWCDEYEE